MTPSGARLHAPLTVGRRLLLGMLPALLSVVLAIGLAYYGQLGRRAPTIAIVTGIVLAVASVGVAWSNLRNLGVRITRLAGTMAVPNGGGPKPGGADELDRIEQVVDRLGSALSHSEAERRRVDATAAARLREQGAMLHAATAVAAGQLEQVRLPLHILLESRFGELNENQEELLRDARAAGDAMAEELRRLALVAEADRGTLPVQRELVQVNDVVRAVLPLVRASAERQGARVDVELEPGLPRVTGDRARLAEALTLLSGEAAIASGPERPMRVATAREADGVVVTIAPRGTPATAPEIVATRLITAQGGTTRQADGGVQVHLRADRATLVRSATS